MPKDSEHLAAFWGALDALTQRYSWGKPLTTDSETVANFWLEVITENRECFEEHLLMANGGCGCCPDPVYRYTSAGVREVSRDGGETWQPDPSDPRISGNILPPPPWLTTPGTHECEGAAVATQNIHSLMDEILSSGATGLQALYEIISGLICIYSVGILCVAAELIAALALIITELTEAYIDGVLTDTVYDELLCIIYCHIEPDATFTESGWQAIKTDLDESSMSADAKFVLWQLINAFGPSGLTNLARLSVAVSADCSECPSCEPCTEITIENGTLIDQPDPNVFVIESVDDGFGQQVIIVNFGGGEDNCCFVDDRVITGAAPFENYWPCGEPDSVGGSPVNHCIWRWRINTGVGGAAFGVTLTTGICP